jgi:1-acyl-sn-glycerol-3-phosphate acyltransferase
VYDFLKRINAASLRRNWRIEGDGLERLEGFRSGILAFNHGHFVDGTVVMPLVRERMLFMCDARAVDAPILGHVLRAMGVLRVDVTRPDPGAAVAAARAASAGHLLGVFPEGRISGGGGLLPARPGVAHLAAKLELPVLPVAMWGLEAFNRPLDVYVRRTRPVIHVRVGMPQAVSAPAGDRDALRAAADAIMLLIADMLPIPMRGVYRDGSQRYERGCRSLDAGCVRPLRVASSREAPPRVVVGW